MTAFAGRVHLPAPWINRTPIWFMPFRILWSVLQKDDEGPGLMRALAVEHIDLITSEKFGAFDDLLDRAAMLQCDKSATIRHIDLGDPKPIDLQMAMEKYPRGWFDEELLKELVSFEHPGLLRNQPPGCLFKNSQANGRISGPYLQG